MFNLKSKSDQIMLGNYINQKLVRFVDSFNKYLNELHINKFSMNKYIKNF